MRSSAFFMAITVLQCRELELAHRIGFNEFASSCVANMVSGMNLIVCGGEIGNPVFVLGRGTRSMMGKLKKVSERDTMFDTEGDWSSITFYGKIKGFVLEPVEWLHTMVADGLDTLRVSHKF